MNRETLTDEMQSLAREIFQDPDLILTDSLSSADVESWTSLSFMQFLKSIEAKYGFQFRMTELFLFRNMGAVIDATLSHIA